jgi:hypothetical protein
MIWRTPRARFPSLSFSLLVVALLLFLWSRGQDGGRTRTAGAPIRSVRTHPGAAPDSPNGDPDSPDPKITPGAIDARVTQDNIAETICRRGYTKTVRPPFEYTNRLKHELLREYGLSGSIHDYELDHLIPLELGGCPDCKANLWPERWNGPRGAHAKDQVENYLNREVCSGALSLSDAQHMIATDWAGVYRHITQEAMNSD